MGRNYQAKLNPKRGFMIERAQPFTKLDTSLVRNILNENDEAIIGIGSAATSHAIGEIMTAGERIEVIDHTLKAACIDPNRYILIPVEDVRSATEWVAECMMLTPRWNTYYTRNFRNASMFASFQNHHNYKIRTIEEQKPELDLHELMAESIRGKEGSGKKLMRIVPEAAIEKMQELGIFDRVDAIYNRKNHKFNGKPKTKRALFLGGFQPFTGVYEDNNGHISNVRLGLEKCDEIVVAVGSAQDSHKERDPLTVGQRIEIINYALSANGIDGSRFYTIPVKDIDANACYASKVISLCPKISAVIAGNDWTKALFGFGDYEMIPVERNPVKGTDVPISATLVRDTSTETIRKNHKKDEEVSEKTISDIEKKLEGMVDEHGLKMMKEVGFYDIMHFLAFAKE